MEFLISSCRPLLPLLSISLTLFFFHLSSFLLHTVHLPFFHSLLSTLSYPFIIPFSFFSFFSVFLPSSILRLFPSPSTLPPLSTSTFNLLSYYYYFPPLLSSHDSSLPVSIHFIWLTLSLPPLNPSPSLLIIAFFLHLPFLLSSRRRLPPLSTLSLYSPSYLYRIPFLLFTFLARLRLFYPPLSAPLYLSLLSLHFPLFYVLHILPPPLCFSSFILSTLSPPFCSLLPPDFLISLSYIEYLVFHNLLSPSFYPFSFSLFCFLFFSYLWPSFCNLHLTPFSDRKSVV